MPEATIIETQEDLDAFFEQIGEDFYGASRRDLMEAEVAIVEELTRDRFENQVAANGEPLAPLSPLTVARKGHNVVLLDSGRLGVSLTQRGHSDAVVEVVDEPGQAGFSRGTGVEYSGPLGRGTKHMPARPHVGVNEAYVDGAAERAADHAIELLKEGV